MKLPKSKRPIRYVCRRCGGWRDGDANKLIVAGIEGFEPDAPETQQIASARAAEMPFISRHGKTCRATIDIIYPSSPQWKTLKENKRED